MMNGRVISSERPGHSILEGMHVNLKRGFYFKLMTVSLLHSAQSTWRSCCLERFQLSRGGIWMVWGV